MQIFSKPEWPTLGLAALIYGLWLAATFWSPVLPWPLRVACGGWLVAWHSSLQHEAIHGHPTPWRWANTAIAGWPLSLWLPYPLYRDSHLAHHVAATLTLPGEDPESHYIAPAEGWLGRFDHGLARASSTLLGRLVFGPAVIVARFLAGEMRAVLRGRAHVRAWAFHLCMAVPVLAWLLLVCRMSLPEYLLAFAYPGVALTLLRSFVEHRADAEPDRRVAVVEGAPLLGLLFLHNNLHALHHRQPGLAWYRLPATYRSARAELVRANGGLVYAGYGEVFRRFLLRSHDSLVHPRFDEADRL